MKICCTVNCLTVLAAILLVGCSTQSDRPATYPVRGTITYQGKPVADAESILLVVLRERRLARPTGLEDLC